MTAGGCVTSLMCCGHLVQMLSVAQRQSQLYNILFLWFLHLVTWSPVKCLKTGHVTTPSVLLTAPPLLSSRVPLWSCGCLWSSPVSFRRCFLPGVLWRALPSWVCPAALTRRDANAPTKRSEVSTVMQISCKGLFLMLMKEHSLCRSMRWGRLGTPFPLALSLQNTPLNRQSPAPILQKTWASLWNATLNLRGDTLNLHGCSASLPLLLSVLCPCIRASSPWRGGLFGQWPEGGRNWRLAASRGSQINTTYWREQRCRGQASGFSKNWMVWTLTEASYTISCGKTTPSCPVSTVNSHSCAFVQLTCLDKHVWIPFKHPCFHTDVLGIPIKACLRCGKQAFLAESLPWALLQLWKMH